MDFQRGNIMKDFKHELESAFSANEEAFNGKATIAYLEVSGHTVAILGFYFKGLNEARVDFATFDSEGVELPNGIAGNTFKVRDVMAIMSACKGMAETLNGQHRPERIAFIGAEAKRFSLYQRVAKKFSEGKRIWTEEKERIVWVELYEDWI